MFENDTPLHASLPSSIRGTVEALTINVREGVKSGRITHPEVALQKVIAGKGDLDRRLEGQNKNDIEVVYGGLMAVPLTFVTGCLLDDESQIRVFDWDRTGNGRWREIENGGDDSQRLQTVCQIEGEAEEAVLALSVSYEVDVRAIHQAFEGIPLMHLRMPECTSNGHWSQEKQAALSLQFLQALKEMGAKGVKKIHLIIAAPNSVVFSFGKIFDRRNLPSATVYQYERTATPAYPWGVVVPTHGIDSPSVVYLSLAPA